VEVALQALARGSQVGRIGLDGPGRPRPHRRQHPADITVFEHGVVEQRRDLTLVALGAVGGRRGADGALRVTDAPVPVARLSVVGAVAADAAHQPDERVGTPLGCQSRVPCPPLLADGLDALEQDRVDGRLEPCQALLLVGPALVADDPTGVERVYEDLGKARSVRSSSSARVMSLQVPDT
jgi:hypothetical protein